MEVMAGDTGAPGFIPLIDDGTPFAPVEGLINPIATALNAALGKTGFSSYTTLALLLAATGTVNGQHATVTADPTAANNGDYFWDNANTRWVAYGASTVLLASATTATVNVLANSTPIKVATLSVNYPVARQVKVVFTAAAQPGASSVNVAGNLYGIQIDATAGSVTSAVANTARIANLNAAGNTPIYTRQEATIIVPSGAHTIDVQASVDSASGTTLFYNNPRIEVWKA